MSQPSSSSQLPPGVSERDGRIYHQVMVEGRTQREVAAEHRISQPRVGKIVRRVFRLLCQEAPNELDLSARAVRHQAAARAYLETLAYCEAEALEAYELSKRRETIETSFAVSANGTQLPKIRKKVRFTQRSSQGDIRYLQAAHKFACLRARFEGFARTADTSRDPPDNPLTLGIVKRLGEK
jgi:hypothetical protein